MSLDTQKFPLKRNWLSTALSIVPGNSDVFSKASLDMARKAFLAGRNQLSAIRNWLVAAEVLRADGRSIELSELGVCMAAQDARAREAMTWWLVHLHLSANLSASPYSTFFTTFDVDSSWIVVDDVIPRLMAAEDDNGETRSVNTVKTYFEGVDRALRPGESLYGLGLVERREIADDQGRKPGLRRAAVSPPDILVLYATLLFQKKRFPNQATVDTRDLLKAGLAKSLGMKDNAFREALSRIHHDSALGKFLQYRKQVNLDSVSFLKQEDKALRLIRPDAYKSGGVTWS